MTQVWGRLWQNHHLFVVVFALVFVFVLAFVFVFVFVQLRFGGDPGRITISGLSAGAVSVHAHVLSPEGKDYRR